jgi:hypothetical protein
VRDPDDRDGVLAIVYEVQNSVVPLADSVLFLAGEFLCANTAGFVAGVRARFGARVAGIRLFGSYARGEAHEESDVDCLVLLDHVEREGIDLCRRATLPRTWPPNWQTGGVRSVSWSCACSALGRQTNGGHGAASHATITIDTFKSDRERAMTTTRYFEEQVLRKRPYLQREWCERVIANPVQRAVQADGRIRFWGRVPEFGNRVLRVVTLEDGVTVHNAFLDRDFVLAGDRADQKRGQA